MSASSARQARGQLPQDALMKRSDLDPWTRFLYVPRTVTALIVGTVGLIWYSGAFDPHPPNKKDYRASLLACSLVYLGYSTLQGPSSVMIRPHPTVWKFVHGCSMLYFLALVWMLMNGKDEARQMLKVLDPSLGKELNEREYGGDCRLYIEGQGWNFDTLKATLFDEFVIAHTLGWWAKALIMRNWWMLWTCSIGFELMELTFQHWLLNFNECWWDSWILDVAVCNLGGMAAGMWTVRYFGSKKYDWQGLSKQKNLLSKAQRSLLQFTPHTLEVWNWATFSSPLRFAQTCVLVVVIMAFELNAFFLKTLLWVPPPHFLNVARLVLLGILALPGVKEYHAWLDSDDHNVFTKLGPYAWLAGAILATETLIVIKFGREEFTAPFPERVKIFWAVFFSVLGVVMVIWQLTLWTSSYMRKGQSSKTKKRA